MRKVGLNQIIMVFSLFCFGQFLFPLLTIRTWVNRQLTRKVMSNVIVNTSQANIHQYLTLTNHQTS